MMPPFLPVQKYPVTHPLLKKLVKYFWVIQSQQNISIHHTLVPVSNSDVVLNFSSPITYVIDETHEIRVTGFHVNGIRNRAWTIFQSGNIDIIGIAFFPMGLYPFIKISVAELTDQAVALDGLNTQFVERVGEVLTTSYSLSKKLQRLEQALLSILDEKLVPHPVAYHIMNTFSSGLHSMHIAQYCDAYGIHPRTFERVFTEYVGIRPKLFQRLYRFQRVLNVLLHQKYSTLTAVAHEHEYYDQAHFIKDFIAFAGCSPTQFLAKGNAVKQIMLSDGSIAWRYRK